MQKRKGIILAGGSGTRLYPLTLSISKHLLPVFDKPMIYYPLSTLMLARINDILIISTERDIPLYKNLLGDGSNFGINLSYVVQDSPRGIADAFIVGKNFINNSPTALILGDNIFHGNYFAQILKDINNKDENTVFAYYVKDPSRYGIVEFENNNIISIKEKPKYPKSNYAVTGLYFYDKDASYLVQELSPSKRGELEITDLNNIYLNNNNLSLVKLGRGYVWLDTGTVDSLLEASEYVSSIENRQGLKISCPEEIAWRNGWIDDEMIIKIGNKLKNSEYGRYLIRLIDNNQ